MKLDKYDVIFTVGFVMRAAGIWVPQLWYDENFTLILARLPFDRMIAATAGDVHPPLWYIIEWGWVRIFPDPGLAPAWTLRIPAFAFSLFAFVAFSHVVRNLMVPERVRIGALTLMAILPMQIWYAQEARMYSLLELEVLLALLFALQRKYIGLFVTSVAILYTQNYAVFYLACIGLVVALVNWRFYRWMRRSFKLEKEVIADIFKDTKKTIVTFGLAVLLFLPWAHVVANQMTTINGRYWIQEQSVGDVLNTIYKLFWHSSMPSHALFVAILATFMAIMVGLLRLLKGRHSSRPATLTILIMAFGPLLLAWIASAIWQPILLFRPLIGSAPFLYIIAVWWTDDLFKGDRVNSWRETSIAAALAIPVIVSGVGGYYKNIPQMKNDGAVSPLIGALDYVKANWQAGDVIYYTDDGPMVNLVPYAGGLPQYIMAACGERMNVGPVLGSLSPATRAAIGIPVAELSELEYTRAWVFAPRSPLHPQCYEDHIAQYTPGDPLIVVDDNAFISSGVWLITKTEKP